MVFIVLRDAELKQEATNYFEATAQAVNSAQAGIEGPAVSCKMDSVTNPNAQVRSVSCVGEGGPARYAYIKGSGYDVFVDGYSKGYAEADVGNFTSEDDYLKILASFKFSSSTSSTSTSPSASPPPATTPSSNAEPISPSPTTQPTIEKFTITVDDESTSMSEIKVTRGNIVQITFNAGPEIYYGGLDLRSSVVNSGTIPANGSKTISFNATESFVFVPYWPASGVAKDYTIKVTVQDNGLVN